MQITKHIPARTVTTRFLWLRREFMLMSPRYREIRSRHRSPMDACFGCGHRFEDGEMMALAAPEKSANKLLCQSCADKLEPRTPSQGEDA